MSGSPQQSELTRARGWFNSSFRGGPASLPISFIYDGKKSSEILSQWNVKWQEINETRSNLTITDPASGLELRIEITLFSDYPAVEWVSYFKNISNVDTPIISDIKALDTSFPIENYSECHVHYAKGSDHRFDDFAPVDTMLRPGENLNIHSNLRLSSSGKLPFFNAKLVNNGIIGAVGWTGDWQANFNHTCEALRLDAGMKKTHLKLHPGEEIRTPRIMLLFWEDDRMHGHNMLRRFLLTHHSPRTADGSLLQAPICQMLWGENMADRQMQQMRWWAEKGIPIDSIWIDAGWYGDAKFKEGSTVYNSEWFTQAGNWWPNKTTYPDGLKPIGDMLKELNVGLIVWFEPERVFKQTRFNKEHPEWLLGPIGDNYLVNLGIPEAREAITNLISNAVAESGITGYRQDFNTNPSAFWEAADEPDRIGMSEIKHIEGLYAFWDELLRRHPGLLIDNCSGGGRRIDLEMISRSIALWRSDYQCIHSFDPIGMQGQMHGLGMWVPLSNGSCENYDTYSFRSALAPGISSSIGFYDLHTPPESAVEQLKLMFEQAAEVHKYFYGDFYPLLNFSLSDDTWAVWQFDRPDLGEGMLLAFRRQNSPFPTMQAKLHGLSSEARYEVSSLDNGGIIMSSGKELAEHGIELNIEDMPGSALYVYRQAKQ